MVKICAELSFQNFHKNSEVPLTISQNYSEILKTLNAQFCNIL